jgi:hypothetical protein
LDQLTLFTIPTHADLDAGTVVVNSNFYKDTSGNILNEICEPCLDSGLHSQPWCAAASHTMLCAPLAVRHVCPACTIVDCQLAL